MPEHRPGCPATRTLAIGSCTCGGDEPAPETPTTCMTCFALIAPGYEPEHVGWHSDLLWAREVGRG